MPDSPTAPFSETRIVNDGAGVWRFLSRPSLLRKTGVLHWAQHSGISQRLNQWQDPEKLGQISSRP